MKVSKKVTYTFDEAAIKALIVEELASQGVSVLAEELRVDITSESWGGYREEEHVPAKINGISVTVDDD